MMESADFMALPTGGAAYPVFLLGMVVADVAFLLLLIFEEEDLDEDFDKDLDEDFDEDLDFAEGLDSRRLLLLLELLEEEDSLDFFLLPWEDDDLLDSAPLTWDASLFHPPAANETVAPGATGRARGWP